MQAGVNCACPSCRRMLKLASRLLGCEATCPSCGHVFFVSQRREWSVIFV